MEIRSYRSVFELERRIYRIDRLRLNPSGVPVRGVVYFLCLILAMLVLRGLPLSGQALGVLPWYVTDLGLPGGVAALLTLVRVEGRPAHLAGRAIVAYALGPRRLSGLRPVGARESRWGPGELLILPDGSDPGLRRLRYRGPGAVLVRVGHELRGRRPVRMRGVDERGGVDGRGAGGGHGQVIVLSAKGRLQVRR